MPQIGTYTKSHKRLISHLIISPDLTNFFSMNNKTLSLLVALLLSFFAASNTQAQYYKTSIGARLGWAYGFTVKHFFTEKIALEGIVSTRFFGARKLGKHKKWGFNSDLGVNVTGLVEWHFPIGKIEGFNWFVGGGLHVGTWRGGNGNSYYDKDGWYFVLGLDAIGGVEYTFSKIPLTLQADIKPTFNFAFGGKAYGGFDEIGISARYTFK